MCYLIDAFMRLSKVFNCMLCTVRFVYTHSTATIFLCIYDLHTSKLSFSVDLKLVEQGCTAQ